MGGLKEDIKHEIFLKHPENIMEAMQFSHHIQAKIRATHKYTWNICRKWISIWGSYGNPTSTYSTITEVNRENKSKITMLWLK